MNNDGKTKTEESSNNSDTLNTRTLNQTDFSPAIFQSIEEAIQRMQSSGEFVQTFTLSVESIVMDGFNILDAFDEFSPIESIFEYMRTQPADFEELKVVMNSNIRDIEESINLRHKYQTAREEQREIIAERASLLRMQIRDRHEIIGGWSEFVLRNLIDESEENNHISTKQKENIVKTLNLLKQIPFSIRSTILSLIMHKPTLEMIANKTSKYSIFSIQRKMRREKKSARTLVLRADCLNEEEMQELFRLLHL
jgi:hypothetical protein